MILMANEVQRVGKFHFIQTPNKYFFIEPHYFFLFFQFLPQKLQVFILSKTKLSRGKKWNKEKAIDNVKEINLLSTKQMQTLFPNSNIYKERLLLMNKSITSYNL